MTKTYDNSGKLGKNKYKKEDKHPDLSGKATINGVEMTIGGWAKKDSEGKGFYSLQFQVKQERQNNVSVSSDDIDDEIPF